MVVMKHIGLVRNVLTQRDGNLALIAAIMLPVVLGAAGMAIDVGQAMTIKSELQVVADAAVLATASAMADKDMTEAEAEAFAKSYFASQAALIDDPFGETVEQKAARIALLKSSFSAHANITSTSPIAKSFDVSVVMSMGVPLSGLGNLLGMPALTVTVASTSASGREGSALSMYLALDESGSMAWDTTTVDPAKPTNIQYYSCGQYQLCARTVTNYITKMESLKAAAAGMFTELAKADPKSELIRLGATSYDDRTKTEQAMGWGPTLVASYVNRLPAAPDGGTDAQGAMTNALNALKNANATEKTEHAKKGNANFERFIVLMTDGEMTGASASWNSTIDSKVRVLCKAAKDDGIKVYTVAFMAPDRGKSLLSYCASGASFYFEPDSMASLVQSFGEIARKAAKTGTILKS
jgi:Flp pilus assembly protein TadG